MNINNFPFRYLKISEIGEILSNSKYRRNFLILEEACEICDSLGMKETKQKIMIELIPIDENDSFAFLEDFIKFTNLMKVLTRKVLTSAVKRRIEGNPSLDEQNWEEQIEHMIAHQTAWLNEEPDTEESVMEEALHTACRANLALFAYTKSKQVPVQDLLR